MGAQKTATESPANTTEIYSDSNDCSDANEKQSNQVQEEDEKEVAKREYKAEDHTIPEKKMSKKSIKQTKFDPLPLKKPKNLKSDSNATEIFKDSSS